MAFRDATEEELSLIQGASSQGGFRDATPEELAVITGQVKPGDVAARKAQVAAQAAAEQPNKAREDLSIPNEATQGTGNFLEGVGRTLGALIPGTGITLKDTFVPNVSFDQSLGKNIRSILNVAPIQAALGAAQALSAPLAPISNLATRAGEKVSEATGSDILAGLTQAALETLAPGALAKGAKALKPAFKGAELFKSPRSKAAEITARETENIAATEARAAKSIRSAEQTAESTTARLESQLAGAQPARESIESITEAAKRNLPSKEDLRRIAGDQLAESTGEAFRGHYEAVRGVKKQTAENLYDAALGPKQAGEKSAVDVIDNASGIEEALKGRKLSADELDQLIKTGSLGAEGGGAKSLRELHEDLITSRRLHRIATKSQEDNIARRLGQQEEKIRGEMEALSPGVTGKLAAADAFYAKEFAPYFSKGSVTRAIAEKDPAAIARNAILPRSKSGKEVETIERTLGLIGDNEALRKQVAQSHLNGLIDEASNTKDFREGFIKGWERFTNPSGNNNKVLRKAYGKEYDEVNSIVNQFKSTKPKDLDDLAAQMVGKINKAETAAEKGILAAGKEREAAIRSANKVRDIELELAKKRLKEGVEEMIGKPGNIANKLQSIGSGVLVSGTVRRNFKVFSAGGVIALSARALSKVLETTRGRTAWKAVMRAAPGTTQAAANARIISNILRESGEEGNNEG